MKAFLYVLLPILAVLPGFAHADEPLRFAADVSDEALAEDAILLVHCLASHTNRGWELGGEAHGPYSLRVTEKDAKLTAVYQGSGGEKNIVFGAGESDQACDKLEPAQGLLADAKPLAPERPLAAFAPPPPLASIPPGELLAAAGEEPSRSKTLLWVGAGIAAVAGGYLLLHARSHRADFSAIQMN